MSYKLVLFTTVTFLSCSSAKNLRNLEGEKRLLDHDRPVDAPLDGPYDELRAKTTADGRCV